MPGRRVRIALSLLGALLVSSCGGSTGQPGAGGEDDGGATTPAGSWVLVEAHPAIDVPADARVTLDVTADGDAWQVGGTSACNSYSGTVHTDGSAWDGEGYGQTEMACQEPLMTIEAAYLDALLAIDTWSRPTADALVLTGPDVELRYAALPPVPTADLTATTWRLDGLVAGTGSDATVSSTAPDADTATLQLEPDGTVSASTGCRAFTGEWVERGDEVVMTTFGVRPDSPNVAADGTPTCSEAVVTQEHHVLSVLGDGFRAEIDGRRLTLVSHDGLGLSYLATDGDDAVSDGGPSEDRSPSSP